MPSKVTAPAEVQLKPLRLNFAQFCLWCSTRWCESARCIELHEDSAWMVCDVCDGTGVAAYPASGACDCAHGLTQVQSNRLAQVIAEQAVKTYEMELARAGTPRMEIRAVGCPDSMEYLWVQNGTWPAPVGPPPPPAPAAPVEGAPVRGHRRPSRRRVADKR